ncbi:hypothetical protein PV11_05212 [Exophiala sideris]|uniref:Uncharacterized protein n=1 Tax=Exophiala sideris TaxID=1016849 RepID=A0A0D1YJV9_9EURO|nr:hypothetical protein PV11_05212 [Exophiala sideris]
MLSNGGRAVYNAQQVSDILPPERPKPVREPWHRPKYKGDYAFQLNESGGLKPVREPKARATNSGTATSGIATGTPSSSDATSMPTLAKPPAPDDVKSRQGKTARTAVGSYWASRGPRSPSVRDAKADESSDHMLFQPETIPISQEQLVKEVKGIYAGLVMVEQKCIDVCSQQAQGSAKLSNEQWQGLIALHRTLLHEHHDFFLAGQHPTASPALRRLRTDYAMPARMWRHGIHAFLELLRHRLPSSLDHMLAFVYLAHQMVSLLTDEVSEEMETWSECLGDLARYRKAIDEADMRDQEIWSSATRMRHDRRIPLDWTACESLQDRRCRVLADPDAVSKLRTFADAGASSSQYPVESASPMIRQLDSSDYMNAKSRFELQAALVSRECLSIILDQVMDPENPASRLEDQKNLVLEAQDIVSRHDWNPVPVDCADTTRGITHIASLLVHHHDFLRASQHDQAPAPLHDLARKYMFPERIWKDGLDSLMQYVTKKGSFEDMLQWLKFCYDYVEEVRQAAPDLESDWVECHMGLDHYFDGLAKEMKRCLRLKKRFRSSSRPISQAGDKDYIHSSMASMAVPVDGVCDYLARTKRRKGVCDGPGDVTDPRVARNSEPPRWQAERTLTRTPGLSVSEGSDIVSSLTHRTMLPFVALDNPGDSQIETSGNSGSSPEYFDAPEWPADAQVSEIIRDPESIQDPDNAYGDTSKRSILCKSQAEFLALRADVLQGWMIIGQTFSFKIYVKVYVILALGVPDLHRAGARE